MFCSQFSEALVRRCPHQDTSALFNSRCVQPPRFTQILVSYTHSYISTILSLSLSFLRMLFFFSTGIFPLTSLVKAPFLFVICLVLIHTFISVIITFEVKNTVSCAVNEFCSPRWKKASEGRVVMRCRASTCHNDSCIVDNNCFHFVYAKSLHLSLMSCSSDPLIE